MKPIVKQKLSTLQDIINNAQSGGGGTVDAYTKAEADAKFETKTDAASTYLSKSDAANMQRKIISTLSIATEGETIFMQATISNFNSLNDLDGATLIFSVHGEGEFSSEYIAEVIYIFILDNNLKFFNYGGTEVQDVSITLSNNILTIKYDMSDAGFDFVSGKLAVIF